MEVREVREAGRAAMASWRSLKRPLPFAEVEADEERGRGKKSVRFGSKGRIVVDADGNARGGKAFEEIEGYEGSKCRCASGTAA